jgi:sec-independent protein translocase protein TatA
MGSMSIWHWLLVIAVVLLLFGRGKISELMGDFARGIKSFKQGLKDDEQAAANPENKPLNAPGEPANTATAAQPAKEQVKG